jgi:hypothetical protein
MTICSWNRQSAERFLNWKHAHPKSVVLLSLAAGFLVPVILLFVQPFRFVHRRVDADDRIVILRPPPEHSNRESRCLTMNYATSAGRG